MAVTLAFARAEVGWLVSAKRLPTWDMEVARLDELIQYLMGLPDDELPILLDELGVVYAKGGDTVGHRYNLFMHLRYQRHKIWEMKQNAIANHERRTSCPQTAGYRQLGRRRRAEPQPACVAASCLPKQAGPVAAEG